MKRFGKSLAYFIFVVVAMLFFLPKINLYYLGESFVEKYKIVMSQEKLTDQGLTLKIDEGKLYYDDLMVAHIDHISIKPLIVFNAISVSPFTFSKDMEQFLPLGIESFNITHTVFSPLHVSIESSGDFGYLSGDIALYDRSISLVLTPSKLLVEKNPFWLKRMKKTTEGDYRYESNY
jgi:hypothetical protein